MGSIPASNSRDTLQIQVSETAALMQIIFRFPPSLEANARILLKLENDHFLVRPFKFTAT
jgi:hypothetical protein